MTTESGTGVEQLETAPRGSGGGARAPGHAGARKRVAGWFAFRNTGAIYIWILIIVVFGFINPSDFLTFATVKAVLNEYAISGLIALSVVIPLATGLFDLSVGYTMGLAMTMVAWFLANTGMSFGVAIVATLAIGVFIGLVNGFIVVFLGIDSLIATLGTGSIIGAITIGVSGNETIVKNVGGSFATDVAGRSWANISEPVLFMLIVMLIVGVLLEQTVAGRYWYAIGFDLDVTRLAGVRVRALRVSAFVIAATIASIAGITLAARIGASSPGEGPDYLLPAFAAAFLGATQFRNGRFNAWGAVVATLLLGTGDYGILLVGGPTWAPQVFEGVVLIAAVGVTEIGKRKAGAGKWTGLPAWWGRIFTAHRGDG